MIKNIVLWILGISSILQSCQPDSKKEKEKRIGKKLDFSPIIGIKYFEVKRRFSNGLSFNEMGFQQQPTWIIQFKSSDTVLAWSPQKKRMQPFYLLFDHGNVYNFAKEYFRIKQISKDSLLFQRLFMKGKEIIKDIRSDVNIVYYSENHIKNILKTTPEALKRPTKADTLYIKKLVDKSNRDPKNAKTAFAGRRPVIFKALNPNVIIKKVTTVNTLMGRTEAYDYLFPKYRIQIAKAYQDFAYELTAVVDSKGCIHLSALRYVRPEDLKAKTKTVKAIIDVYLKNLVLTIPGETLGMAHSSEITLVLVGKKT